MEKYGNLLIAALCCAAISHTLCITSIFKQPREYLSKIHPKIEQLVHCPWCLGHYIVFLYLMIPGIKFFPASDYNLVNFIITWFDIICIMGIIHYVLLRAYEPVAKIGAQRKIDKLKEAKKLD